MYPIGYILSRRSGVQFLVQSTTVTVIGVVIAQVAALRYRARTYEANRRSKIPVDKISRTDPRSLPAEIQNQPPARRRASRKFLQLLSIRCTGSVSQTPPCRSFAARTPTTSPCAPEPQEFWIGNVPSTIMGERNLSDERGEPRLSAVLDVAPRGPWCSLTLRMNGTIVPVTRTIVQ